MVDPSVRPSRVRHPAPADSYDDRPQTGDGPPQAGTEDTGGNGATVVPDADGPKARPAGVQNAHNAESDADAVARWLAETLAEAPPVPPAVAALIAGVLVRRPPAA
ncbi:hypothetical protein [Frankia sp. BMG5.23]|uniref:hypothetical protein n=1 Tax=Frankia sp. BMG5.23 TaxID=683305 RepID=UPI00046202DA|nr:hypothetical protein [Frankia sp. BMG5.23]KDA44082.1 hypothetical protein BMG523Draft_01178 [Frankia sp. BMG5.23]